MSHQTDGLSCKSQLSVFSTLIFYHAVAFLLLTHSHGGQAQATGQPQPTLATIGDDITLPCHATPAADAVNQMLEWTRPDFNPRFVHARRSGDARLVDQNPSYEGRTSVSIDGLKHGDLSLKLSRVKVTDEGTYRCFCPGLNTETSVQLVVVSANEITKVSTGVVLHCESGGWYPEPELLWLDAEGHLLSAGPPETVRGPDDLYTVSSRLTVEKRRSNSFTCRVQQKTTNQTRDTHFTVPDDLFSGSSGCSSGASTFAVVVSVVVVMFILAVAFFVWKWRQNQIKKKEQRIDEETQRGEKKKDSNLRNNDSELKFLIERESDNTGKLTAERETMKNQDKMEDEHQVHCLSEGTGRSCPNKEETHRGKAAGETTDMITHTIKDKTGGETRREETKSINKETPVAVEEDAEEEEPEATDPGAAALSQMDKGSIKPAGQSPTDGENNDKKDLDQAGGQTGRSEATQEADGALTPADGQTDPIPEALNGVNKNDEDAIKESTNHQPAGQDAGEGETQRDELHPGGEKDDNVVVNETIPPCSSETETLTEQLSPDRKKDMTSRGDDPTQADKPPADEGKAVEKAEEEKDAEKNRLPCEAEGETDGEQLEKKDEDAQNKTENPEEGKSDREKEEESKEKRDRNPNTSGGEEDEQ